MDTNSEIVWTGKPVSKIRFSPQEYLLIAFVLIWNVGVSVYVVGFLKYPIWFGLAGWAVLVFLLPMLLQKPLLRWQNQKHTTYELTASAFICRVNSYFEKETLAIPLATINGINLHDSEASGKEITITHLPASTSSEHPLPEILLVSGLENADECYAAITAQLERHYAQQK